MIFYLYTGNIYFAPFRSHPKRQELLELVKAKEGARYGPPAVSSKSIYRLADKVRYKKHNMG